MSSLYILGISLYIVFQLMTFDIDDYRLEIRIELGCEDKP